MTDLVYYSPKHRVVKRNVLCAYCGISLEPFKGGEEEHVIGRRFVPKGTLAGQWNLIVRSCPACNDAKADLEDDLSAITMQPDGLGRFAADDDRLRAEAVRKARTRNRRTQQRVSEPTPPLIVKGNFGPANITFSYTAPAQADDRRMFELARLQLVGFFSMLTYDEAAKRGYFWTGQYAPVVVARQEDWGNPRLLWIDAVSRDWEYRLHAIAADGFYKVWIRRRLGEPAVWAWAIEWTAISGWQVSSAIPRQLPRCSATFRSSTFILYTKVLIDGCGCERSSRSPMTTMSCSMRLCRRSALAPPPEFRQARVRADIGILGEERERILDLIGPLLRILAQDNP